MAIIFQGVAGTGPITYSMTRDEEGYREYTLLWRVKSTTGSDGPAAVLRAPGMFLPGAMWNIGTDLDPWVWLRPNIRISPHDQKEGDKVRWWNIEFTYGNKPPQRQRCNDTQIENPLLEPHKKSGSYVKYQEEAVFDRFGRPILTSSHEGFRGQQNEWDANRPQVTIEQNVSSLQLSLISSMVDCLNDRPMWGLPKRCIKLSDVNWEEKFYGTCFRYYTRKFTFDIFSAFAGSNAPGAVQGSGFDRLLLDEGTKALNGEWNPDTGVWDLINIAGVPPNRNNPSHFNRYKDKQGENTRVILDGAGKPFNPDPPMTSSCSQCGLVSAGNGAPQQWLLSGFDRSNPAQNKILTHTGGCTWTATITPPAPNLPYSITLTYGTSASAGGGVTGWYLETGVGPDVWFRESSLWDCKGPNRMDSILGTGPTSVLLVPYGGGSPGSIFVQKYREANLFLLGVPAVIG